MDKALTFTSNTTPSETHNACVKAFSALSNRVNGYRLAIEYIQDYVDIAGLELWGGEMQRLMGYYSEQEANKYLQKKIYDSQSRYQSRAIPIPRFSPPPNDSNINFMGRAVSALLRMTDASTTIYSPECGGWFLRDGTEVMGISIISLLRTSISIPGLLGVDSLLSFRIVNELRQFLKFYNTKVKGFGVLLEQIRDGLFPEWKNIEDNGRLYNAAMKKLEAIMLPILISLRRIGQAQLMRKMVANEVLFRSRLDASMVQECLSSLDESMVSDIRKHYRDSSKPIPSEESPLLPALSTLLSANGHSDPLSKVYITTDPLEGLPIVLLIFITSYLGKLEYDPAFGSLRRTKTSYPLDGWPLVTGVATLLKQFHPSYATSVLAYLGQFVRSTVSSILSPQGSSSSKATQVADLPKEVVNCIVFMVQLSQTMRIDEATLYECIPRYLVETIGQDPKKQ